MSDELIPGAVVRAKYRIDRVLGTGGMGQVLEAFHLQLARRVAAKVLHPDLRDRAERFAFCALSTSSRAAPSGTSNKPVAKKHAPNCNPPLNVDAGESRRPVVPPNEIPRATWT